MGLRSAKAGEQEEGTSLRKWGGGKRGEWGVGKCLSSPRDERATHESS